MNDHWIFRTNYLFELFQNLFNRNFDQSINCFFDDFDFSFVDSNFVCSNANFIFNRDDKDSRIRYRWNAIVRFQKFSFRCFFDDFVRCFIVENFYVSHNSMYVKKIFVTVYFLNQSAKNVLIWLLFEKFDNLNCRLIVNEYVHHRVFEISFHNIQRQIQFYQFVRIYCVFDEKFQIDLFFIDHNRNLIVDRNENRYRRCFYAFFNAAVVCVYD